MRRICTSIKENDEDTRNKQGVATKEQVVFFTPLAVTSLLILTTHSLFNAGLARLPSPEVYIAAFSVAKSLMQLIQSPIIMTKQMVTALVKSPQNYSKVKKFAFALISCIVAIFAVIAISGLDKWIFHNIMGLSGKVLHESSTILKVLVVFPVTIMCRDFFQGISIKFRMTPLVTMATVARIIFVVLVVMLIKHIVFIPPAVIAGLMFLGAAGTEAVVMYLGTRITIRNIPRELALLSRNQPDTDAGEIDFKSIFVFFLPLMLTGFLKSFAIPVVNMGLARTHAPEIALSTFAVAWGLGTIVLSPLYMFHQVPLNFLEDDSPSSSKSVKRFALILGSIVTICMLLISFTNIGFFILHYAIGATVEISLLSMDILKIMSLIPPVLVIRQYYWGILISKHMTRYLGKGKIVNLAALIATLLIVSKISLPNPAIIGITGMLSCEIAETLYLYLVIKKNNELKKETSRKQEPGQVDHMGSPIP